MLASYALDSVGQTFPQEFQDCFYDQNKHKAMEFNNDSCKTVTQLWIPIDKSFWCKHRKTLQLRFLDVSDLFKATHQADERNTN